MPWPTAEGRGGDDVFAPPPELEHSTVRPKHQTPSPVLFRFASGLPLPRPEPPDSNYGETCDGNGRDSCGDHGSRAHCSKHVRLLSCLMAVPATHDRVPRGDQHGTPLLLVEPETESLEDHLSLALVQWRNLTCPCQGLDGFAYTAVDRGDPDAESASELGVGITAPQVREGEQSLVAGGQASPSCTNLRLPPRPVDR